MGDTTCAMRRPRWEVYADEHGNMYFYDTVSGQTAWGLPPDAAGDHEEEPERPVEEVSLNQIHDDDGNVMQLTIVKPRFSPYQIAVEVIETVLRLLDTVESQSEEELARQKKKKRFASPAAEKRAKKNDEVRAKKRKRERLLALTRYMNLLIPPVTTASAAQDGKRPIGALFSREDARQWKLEKEVQQIRQRYAVRKQRDKHHYHVYARAAHHQFLKRFRTELMKHFLAQIPYSSELQQQRILLLSTPQQLAEMERKRRETLEPEMLERFEAEKKNREEATIKNVQKVFVLVDKGATGSVHMLQALFAIFSDERTQKLANQARGLTDLVTSAEIQRFVVDFVSAHLPKEATMNLADFLEFVQTIDEVCEHYRSVRAAVKEAEDEIAAALEAASTGSRGGNSLLKARLNMVSTKKVEQELAALQATQAELEIKKRQETQVPFYDCSEALLLMMAKEEWEKHHHHRFIQIERDLPVYCCLCRRRKWELWRQELEQEESDFRLSYATRYALKMKSEELRLIQKQENDDVGGGSCEDFPREASLTPSVALSSHIKAAEESPYTPSARFHPRDENDRAILQIVRTLVTLTERVHSDEAVTQPVQQPIHQRRPQPKQIQTGSPRKKNKRARKANESNPGGGDNQTLDDVQVEMKWFENEERERKLLLNEDTTMHFYLERTRRHIERPLLLQQEAACNAYIRLLSHCANPCSLLFRLQFERCLSMNPPQHLVLLMTDNATADRKEDLPCRRLVLHTVPCRTEQEAAFVYEQVSAYRTTLKSPFVSPINGSAKHTYQFFADSGMLIECWPVVFVVEDYFPYGTWGDNFAKAVDEKRFSSYAQAELKIINTFRCVAAGLAAMHSCGILHLNFHLDSLFLCEPMTFTGRKSVEKIHISDLLAWKRGYHDGQLLSGDLMHCLNPAIAPPEATTGGPVSAKADSWMLGCALYEALMIWQWRELRGICNGQNPPSPTVIRLKKFADISLDIPLSTSASVRSLLRMLLQPTPSQRPLMSQIVDMLSFAEKKAS